MFVIYGSRRLRNDLAVNLLLMGIPGKISLIICNRCLFRVIFVAWCILAMTMMRWGMYSLQGVRMNR